MPLLRDVLNRIKWHPSESKNIYTVIISDRMVARGYRTLQVALIREIHASYFLYEEEQELKHIPLHHVVRVLNAETGAILWEKRSRKLRD